MLMKLTFSPSDNAKLEEGCYAALITNIRYIEYGEAGGSMLELTFRLEKSGLILDSFLYMPKEFEFQHKLRCFCQALGLEAFEIIEDPDVTVGRKIVLEVTTMHPETANSGPPYSDVKGFLPLGLCDQESDDATKKDSV